MLILRLESSDPLLYAIPLLLRFSENGIIECSPSMFSLIASHHSLDLIVAFQMMPQFFTHFYSNNTTHNSRILLQPLYTTINLMKQSQFSSLSLFVLETLDRLFLKFYSPRNELPLIRKFGIAYAAKEDLGEIDLGTFVSINSQQFRRIVKEFSDYLVTVTPTNSHVTFSSGTKEIVLGKEEGECIIEGIREGVMTEFPLPLHPSHIFYNITFHSERVWLFKTMDLSTLVIAPVGLFAHFAIHFSLE